VASTSAARRQRRRVTAAAQGRWRFTGGAGVCRSCRQALPLALRAALRHPALPTSAFRGAGRVTAALRDSAAGGAGGGGREDGGEHYWFGVRAAFSGAVRFPFLLDMLVVLVRWMESSVHHPPPFCLRLPPHCCCKRRRLLTRTLPRMGWFRLHALPYDPGFVPNGTCSASRRRAAALLTYAHHLLPSFFHFQSPPPHRLYSLLCHSAPAFLCAFYTYSPRWFQHGVTSRVPLNSKT